MGSVDLAVGTRVQRRGCVVDHDDAERAADARIGFGTGLPGARWLEPRSEAAGVQPGVEEILGRGGDLPPDGERVFVGHDDRSASLRPVTKASSEAS